MVQGARYTRSKIVVFDFPLNLGPCTLNLLNLTLQAAPAGPTIDMAYGVKETSHGVTIDVIIQPKSSRNEIVGVHGNCVKGTSKNLDFGGPQKTAQMLGAREPATAAYTVVREDCGRSGQQRRWAVFGGPLKIKLTAPPVDGKANAALIAFLAKKLGIAKSLITILRGETSRRKSLKIDGMSCEELAAILGDRFK